MSSKNNVIAPHEYANAAALADAVCKQMIERLEWISLKPKIILDVGAGAGAGSELLKKYYPDARIFALDNDFSMVEYVQQQKIPVELVCGDSQMLPFKDDSVDFIFANLILPWCQNNEKSLREWRRVLKPKGLLLFSCLGPDTLKTWRDVLANVTLPNLIDMHEIGDVLTRVKFLDSVMDVDYFTLTFGTLEKFFHELIASQMILPGDYSFLYSSLEKEKLVDNVYPVEFEVIYGHAWGPDSLVDQVANEDGIVNIPLSSLRRLKGER